MGVPRPQGFWVDPIILTHWRFKTAGLAGSGLWLFAAVWCSEHHTDGHVQIDVVKALMPGASTAMAKVAKAGLWLECTEHETCLELRAFLVDEHGRPRRESQKEREVRLQKERDRSATRRRPARDQPVAPRSDAGRDLGVDIPSSKQVPPLPPQGEAPAKPSRSSESRGTRLPEPFMLTAEMRRWAAEEVPDLDVQVATRKFVDYWRGVPGVRGRKLDWQATWRNSLRNDPARIRSGAAAPQPELPPRKKFT